MGETKQYLMEKTSELADKLGIPEADFYQDQNLNNLTLCYANYMLKKEKQREVKLEVERAILTRLPEAEELIQKLLTAYACPTMRYNCVPCEECPFGFLCERSSQYK